MNLRRLQSGGHGDLSVGQRSDDGVWVAVKFLREGQLPHSRKAFLREIRILGKGIPGVVKLLGANTDAPRPFYVMPYFPRGSLTQYAGRLFEIQLHAVATELAGTLAGLHWRNIQHGDFKPDNILVTQEGQLQVADPLGNGIGCTMPFSNNHGGTLGYMAPEVSAGGSISCAGDVYSYGATLSHLLTGQKPQQGQPLSTQGNVDAPRIREIISACCQFDPNARPNMREVLAMLRGKSWSDIQASRKQIQDFAKAVCIVGAVAVSLRAISK